jgi:hypothetical protein
MELTGGRPEQGGGGDITHRRGVEDAFMREREERERERLAGVGVDR